jgi:hypothetical protein
VKRTGDWGRKKPLRNHTPLTPGGSLSRSTPLSRTSPMPRSSARVRTQEEVRASRRPLVTPEERSARKVVKARSAGRCEMCGRAEATDMHHRKNRSQGGQWSPDNLLHLCHADHMSVTVSPALARSRGWSVRSTDDPASVPVWLAGRGWNLLTADGGTHPTTERGVA